MCYNSDKMLNDIILSRRLPFLFTGQFEFTWQQFMIGIESSLIMFPVNFIIVTIFRQTCPREMSCFKCKTAKADATELANTLQTPSSTNMSASVTLDSITDVGASHFYVLNNYLKCLLMPHIGRLVDMFKIATDA